MRSTEKVVKIDQIDKKILTVLLRNGRINLTELSSIIGHNYPTVRDRLTRLVDKGVITHFYPIVQFPGIGLRRYMSVYLTLKKDDEEKVQSLIKKLCENNFLIEVLELEGKWNVSALLTTNYIKQAYETLNWIQQVCEDDLL